MAKSPMVYGVFPFRPDARDGMLIFFKKTDALDLATAWDVIRIASTWGELRERDHARYAEGMKSFDDLGETHPGDDEPLDRDIFAAFTDDSTPLDAMTDFLPEELKALGSRGDRPGSGDWVTFGIAQEKAVVRTLTSLGYVVERDDALVRKAGGNWIDENFPENASET